MKKFTSILLALCLCLSVCTVFAACSKAHEHSFATEWSKDATHHWHACIGEGCTDVVDKAEHTWNAGEITTPATATADGIKTFTCTACGATKTESVQLVTTVTKEQWDAAIASHNYTLTAVKYDEKDIFIDSYTIMVTETAFCSISPYVSYIALQDDIWYLIDGDSDEGYFGAPIEVEYSDYTFGQVLLDETDFALWSYDAEKNAYSYSNDDGALYLYFENGIVTRVESDQIESYGEKIIATVSNVGTTTVEVPDFTAYGE